MRSANPETPAPKQQEKKSKSDDESTMSDNSFLLDLPPELRERIYFFACSPLPEISTASIPGTPDHITLPALTRVSRQIRDEAMAVFTRSRPVEISLHSVLNQERAIAWLDQWSDHARLFDVVVITGRLKMADNDFFCAKIRYVWRTGGYAVEVTSLTQDATKAKIMAHMKGYIGIWLEEWNAAGSNTGGKRLTSEDLKTLTKEVHAWSNAYSVGRDSYSFLNW